MRSILISLLSLATIATSLAVEPRDPKETARTTEDDDIEEVVPDTIFNGVTVPPMKELGQADLEKEISHGNWLVEFFSPSCPHCIAFKPTWQTLYEFYYTSKPIDSNSKEDTEGDSLNSFTRYYDFKFAKVDCIAYKDTCVEKDISSFPSIVQFKDGQEVKRQRGTADMDTLSKWVEEILETTRPGSRKEGGPKLPEVGANSVKTGPDTEDEVKEQEEKKAEKEKEEKEAATPSPVKPSKAAKPTPSKPASTANPDGLSQALTAEKFQSMITNTYEPWFVKFYAPWCHHCQALAPNWSQLARHMKDKLNVGEVNCDVEKKLCKDAKIQGYPTLLLFRGGERIEYEGLRGVGDLLDYAEKATAAVDGVVDVDLEAFKKLEETNEVIFVYFYDQATTSEDFQALEKLTLNLIGHAKLVKTDDPAMVERFKITTFPRLAVSRDGKATYYPPIAPRDMRDSKAVLTWMQSVWLPVVPELTGSNARQVMDGKFVVLAVLNKEKEADFARYKKEIKTAALEWIDKEEQNFQKERQELRDAKQLKIDEAEDRKDEKALRLAKGIQIKTDDTQRKQVGFAWVDGHFWERWTKSIYGVDVKEGERVIINDEDTKRFWDVDISGKPIPVSRTAILETVYQVISTPPQIAPKSTQSSFSGVFYSFGSFFYNHPFLALGMIIGVLFAGSYISKARRGRRGYGGSLYHDSKDGLLGGNSHSGAKHD